MFYTFQATTRPPRCHQLSRYEGNGKRVTTLWVVLEAKVVTRTCHNCSPNVTRVESVASPHSFERK
jgi:hypothetical protein